MTSLPDPPQVAGSSARRKYASAIEDYLSGKIDFFDLDDNYVESATPDEVFRRVRNAMWRWFWDVPPLRDAGGHRIPPEAEAMIRRWVHILRSNAEWEWNGAQSPFRWLGPLSVPFEIVQNAFWPEPRFRDNFLWPFPNEAAWKEWRSRYLG